MKVNIKSLPTGYTISNGKVFKDGGTTGDQSNYGVVGVPHMDNTNGNGSPFNSVKHSLGPVPRDEANLEAEKGETVLTDMNNDGNFELYDIGGNRHFSGGTPLSLPPQSFIYSDTSKMKLNNYELSEMGIESKKRMSPAKVSKNYQLNNFISLLDNEHSDHITRNTAEYMLDKNKKSLSQLAFLQEARKKFDDGVPLAAYPYLQEKGINPLEFSQQMEQISAQEAEQKMMMQLPIEDQLQLLQMKKQQAMMQQQQQMAQQQQQQQQGMHQMPDGTMMPNSEMEQQGPPQGMPQQGPPQMGPPQGQPMMPPQGMMPPQPPMQQPPMARRGGQVSYLPKAQNGLQFLPSVQDGTLPSNFNIPGFNSMSGDHGYGVGGWNMPFLDDDYVENTNIETGNVGELGSPTTPTIEQILAQYEVANNKLMNDFTNQTNTNMNAYQNQMNNMIPTSGQQMGMLGVTGSTDPTAVKIWEDHINQGGPPPTDPDPNYTQAYKNINGGDEPEYENNQNTPVGSNNGHVTNVYNIQNGTEKDDSQSNTYVRTPEQNNNSDQPNVPNGRAQGLPLDYTNTNSPYYVGSDWSFATGGDLPKAQYNFNMDTPPSVSESTSVYTPPEVNIKPFETIYKEGNTYDDLKTKYNPTGLYMNTNNNDPGTIDISSQEKQFKSMAMRNPIASIGVGVGAMYDGIFGGKYGGAIPSYQKRGELTEEEANINFGNRKNPDLVGSSRTFSTNEDIGYSSGLGTDDVTLQKYTGFNLGLDPTNFNKSTNAFMNADFLDRGNNVANLDFTTGINAAGDGITGYAEGRGGIGLGMGNKPHDWIVENADGTTRNTGMQKTNPLTYANPYLSGNAGIDFNLSDTESIGLEGTYNTKLSPYGDGVGARLNFNKGDFNFNVGTDDIFNNPNTSFGASYTFDEGGELPMAKKGKEIKHNGKTYSNSEMKKLKNGNATQVQLYNEIMDIDTRSRQEIANDQTNTINKTRKNTAAVTLEDQVFSGGSGDWTTDYLADSPAAEEYRKTRYDAYADRRKDQGEDVIGEAEYHEAYARMQQHNAYFEQNLTQEQRDTEDWDNGTNDKYHSSLNGSGMEGLSDELIGHVQSGFIGGKALQLSGDDYTEFMHSGVKDQSVFGLAISPEDQKYGNTTNDQRDQYTKNESTEEIGCTNAEGMEAACVEIGGTWTPWDQTAKTGCSCDKQIPPDKIPPPKTPPTETPFWLQDELGMANALDAKMSLQKRYPWAPRYNQIGIDGVFDDPTREIAAIGEQAGIAASAATAFGGPQRAMAASLATQGKAMTAIADTVNKVHGNNIQIANDTNVKNAEMEYKTQMLNNNELKQLYDNTVLTEENYDNSLRQANAAITAQVQNAYTNRADTANLNSIYPQFDIDPASGGMLKNVNNKTFHADPNYVDPATYDESYAKQIEMLRTNKVPENLWPKYTPPGPANPNNSFAKQNAKVITNSGYQGQPARFGRETGRKDRILRKGGQLRNWFSPLRGN